MVSLSTYIYRGKLIESEHKAVCLVKNYSNKIILSSKNKNMLVYPRSAIKIFQALPFINSNAPNLFQLNNKIIAMSCSSHTGELQHLRILNEWIKKVGVKINQLKCGIHNPINLESSNNLLLSGKSASQLHNNCAGKHLSMISGCLANKMDINDYLNFDHPYQKLIRKSLERFMESKIQKKSIGIDGCNAPQYAFSLDSIASSMVNLIKEKNQTNEFSLAINKIIESISKFPFLIGGSDRFDSDIINITEGKIFCKGGAEGVLLFADFKKKLGGVIKILDGNYRAIPSLTMQIFLKLKMLSNNEKIKLNKWTNEILLNHAKNSIGKISSKIK